jgi:hypothetical protein
MGILDDAIREHLELKRAHGAPDAEITQKEAEVFGPVRQEVQAPEAPEAHAATVEAVEAIEPAEPAVDDPYSVHPGDHAVPDPHHEGEPGGSDPAWGDDTELFAEPAAPPQPQPPAEPHRDEIHPALHDTDEHFHGGSLPPEPVYGHEAASPAAPEAPIAPDPEPIEEPEPFEEPAPVEEPEEPGEEDVLEETPEFLQEAPEHDRLWFEQKPPRDFDFGE